MSESKYRHRIPPCAPYDIPAMESWLEDMAAKGLHLSEDGFFMGVAAFEEGPPRNERFRLEATATNGGLLSGEYAPDDDAFQLNRQMGWAYRARRGQFHIYSTADPDAPELHTDPQVRSITISTLEKYLRKNLLVTLLLTAFYAAFHFGDLTVSAAVTLGTWWMALFLGLMLWSLCRQLQGIWTLRRLRKQLQEGEALATRSDYRKKQYRYLVSRAVWWVLTIFTAGHLLFLCGHNLTEELAVELEDYTDPIPFATLADLYPGAEVDHTDSLFDSQVTVWSDFLAPSNYDYSEYADITWEGQNFDCHLTVNYHETRWNWTARRLAEEFISQAGGNLFDQTAARIFGEDPVIATELNIPEADYCAYYYKFLHSPYIVLVKDNVVIRINLSVLSRGVNLGTEEIAKAFLSQLR